MKIPKIRNEAVGYLKNDFLQLDYFLNSPRIVGLYAYGSANMFADLGDYALLSPYGPYYLRGGHRLWCAPENKSHTYIPDDKGAKHIREGNKVCIIQEVEVPTGLQKSIEIFLYPNKPVIDIQHRITNCGRDSIKVAPWALTMFRLGGICIIPLPNIKTDKEGLLPNRKIVYWPFTDIQDPRIQIDNNKISIDAQKAGDPLKIGDYNKHGWMAYSLDDLLFIKRFSSEYSPALPDEGCNSECCCSDQFIELESLGPLRMLAPGDMVEHKEQWEVRKISRKLENSRDIEKMVNYD